MEKRKPKFWFLALVIGMVIIRGSSISTKPAFAQDAAGQQVARKIGAIKSINGSSLILTADTGADIAITVQPNARILKIAPGEKDLKNATPVELQDLQVGDRVRVRGQASTDGTSIAALEIIVMARTDLEAKHQQEQQDWQRRGLGGLVKEVDANAGTVSVSVTGAGGTKSVVIHTSGNTVFRRYAPDSVKFDDAKPSTIQEIHPGNQLRARGERSADGSELTADEIVSGSFRNVAGTVNSVDASSNTINVQDLLSKKPVVVKITPESQLHKLPTEMAQMIAMRLKGGMPPGAPGANGMRQPGAAAAGNGAQGAASAPTRPEGAPQAGAAAGSPGSGSPTGGGTGRRGGGDFQQMLNRTPPVTIADLHKGDAVLIVATEGTSSASTAITLLSGVEPILQAAPSASQAMMLTPWSLGGAPAGGDASQ